VTITRCKTKTHKGPNREVKKAVEAYWGGKLSVEELQKAAAAVRKESLESIKAQGVDFIPRYESCYRSDWAISNYYLSGDFTFYDHVLEHSVAFNAIPKRYQGHGLSTLDVFFAMGRGRQAENVDVPACEMKKW
jgi:5-methyltetrahydropteroyltriglutamate--homocysteine methyltransferase